MASKKAKPSAGKNESRAWLESLKVKTDKDKWRVRMLLDVKDEPAAGVYFGDTSTRCHLEVFTDEWSVTFVHGGKTSQVRVFADGTQDHHGEPLLEKPGKLADARELIRKLEKAHGVQFKREHVRVESNVTGAKAAARTWLLG